MTVTDWLAVIAIVVSAGAFALEVRRWVESGPRLNLRMMADAVEVPSIDDAPKLALFVTNRGSEPTTITHMVVYEYVSWLARLRRKCTFQAVVNTHNVPSEVGVNRQWMGQMRYNERLAAAREAGHLYVGVIASHSERTYLLKVPPHSPELPLLAGKDKKTA